MSSGAGGARAVVPGGARGTGVFRGIDSFASVDTQDVLSRGSFRSFLAPLPVTLLAFEEEWAEAEARIFFFGGAKVISTSSSENSRGSRRRFVEGE
jgi:hypothetical protein